MSRNAGELSHISNGELLAMTKQLDEMHRDHALPAMREAAADWAETLRDERAQQEETKGPRVGRRTFLMGAGALAGGVALAACSSKSNNNGTTTTTASASGGTTTSGGSSSGSSNNDLKVVALAASLENLAVFAYGAGIQAATAGKFGSVPPAVPVFATTAKNQHQDHADAWNAILTGANKQKVTKPDPALTPTIQGAFAQVKTIPELLTLALSLENTAAQTYQVGVTAVTSAKGISTAATIHPVEMQHAAILYYVLGMYPVPNAFNPTNLARPVSDYQGTL